ncbi:MAG: glycosyltransferase [Syntrophales bacterium]
MSKKLELELRNSLSVVISDLDPGEFNADRLEKFAAYGFPVFLCSPEKRSAPVSQLGRILAVEEEAGVFSVKEIDPIHTAWVMWMKKDEYLDEKSLRQLKDLLNTLEFHPRRTAVEMFHRPDLLRTFEWFVTQDVFREPARAICAYFTSELRLMPAPVFREIKIKLFHDDGARIYRLINQAPYAAHEDSVPLIIHREYNIEKSRWSRPPDRELFHDGPSKHFQDSLYIDTFRWPFTSYATARLEHIPGIIEALKEGLSSPRIVCYALNYLFQYGHFDIAQEVLAHIPREWETMFSIILQLKAMIRFCNGDLSGARDLCRKAEVHFPEEFQNLENLGKVYVLLGDGEAARQCFEKARKMLEGKDKGHVRPYLKRFEEILSAMGRSPRLSLCMIARDEEDFLPEAFKYVVDCADEIVFVDTGSKDKSREIAKSLGARVFDFPWHDDFSEARNFAISKATGDYIFMLDADESICVFNLINFRVLKTLLPLDRPQAYTIPIGRMMIETDWFHIASCVDNFVSDRKQIRIFPRLPGIEYKGAIRESIDESISAKKIDVVELSPYDLFLLHDDRNRSDRISRKRNAYKIEESWRLEVVLDAVRDFSQFGLEAETIKWLEILLEKHSENKWVWKYAVQLSRLYESRNPERSRKLLQEMLARNPQEKGLITAYASYLVRFNRLSDLALMNFPQLWDADSLSASEKTEFMVYSALSDFLKENPGPAIEKLDAILSADPGCLPAQAARFYFLSALGDPAGGYSTLKDILEILDCDEKTDGSPPDLLTYLKTIETVCGVLGEREKLIERCLVLQASSFAEKLLERS